MPPTPYIKKYSMFFWGFSSFFQLGGHFRIFPVFQNFPTTFVNTASTRRIDPHQPEASNSKNKISRFLILAYLSDTISSSRPFHRHSISPSTVSTNYGTHLDFAATPYNIDIFCKKYTYLIIGELVDPQIPKPAQKPEMRVAPFLNVFLKTTYS